MDERKWKQAWAVLSGMRNNIPEEVDEKFVLRYHSLLETFQGLLNEDLGDFRIRNDELAPQLIFAVASPGSQGQSAFTDSRYCDRSVMLERLDSVIFYLQSLVEPSTESKRRMGF